MSRKWILVILSLLAISLSIFLGVYHLQSNLDLLRFVSLDDVDLSRIENGTYTGRHTVLPISVEVAVTLEEHRITRIELVRHTHGRGSGAAVIPDRVLEQQSLRVDTVSGATYSSVVILQAIEDALRAGLASSP